MTLIRWIFSLTILAIWCALMGTGVYVALYEPPEETPTAQAIVVLGGAAGIDGQLREETAERMQAGIALYEEGAAPLIVVTGGGSVPVARDMAQAAISAGIPESDILVEDASLSTLQNAILTADFEELDKAQPIIIVTQRYHLPRAWASFRWGGFDTVIRHAADPQDGFEIDMPLLWESVKWPANVVRAAAASAAMAGGVPRESFMKHLE